MIRESRDAKLPLIVVLLCCAGACLASAHASCGYDTVVRLGGASLVDVVAEVPQKGQSGIQAYTAAVSNGWAPLRIVVSTKDLEDPSKYCNETDVERPTFTGKKVDCHGPNLLRPEEIAAIKNPIIPAAVKLHTDRLLVQPVSGPLKVPEF
ncbi:surface protease GP63, partial [Trypanosoma grayi]|uniref:surface protease GP63 n=1 Tax=Trypanosoma grayi TaxID=71804 RepID=UPI0004F48C23